MNRRLVEGLREELADLYMQSCATVPTAESPREKCSGERTPGEKSPGEKSPRGAYRRPDRSRFLTRLTADMRRPGFAMVLAEADGLVGCAYGFPVRGDGSWGLGFDGALPLGMEQLTRSGRAFAFTDILVRPPPQGRELARRLQKRLLTDHRASLGVTSVDQADVTTLAALRSWGWLDAGDVWRPAGPTVFRVLILPFGEQTLARPDELARHAWTRWPD
ncbi:hypothetical protein ACWKT5_37455 [Streptomyces avermitilis]